MSKDKKSAVNVGNDSEGDDRSSNDSDDYPDNCDDNGILFY